MEFLNPIRPASVNIYQIIRDAISRLPDGSGTIEMVVELVSQSQYISMGFRGRKNERYEKLMEIVNYAFPVLINESNPCVHEQEQVESKDTIAKKVLYISLFHLYTEKDFGKLVLHNVLSMHRSSLD